MTTIENYPLTTAELAKFLDVTVGALRNWQTRYGLLKSCTSGTGKPAEFRFRDALSAVVAKKLISARFPAERVCGYVDTFRPGLPEFTLGEDIRVAVSGSEIKNSGDPAHDIFLTFNLEADGWRLAEFIADIIEDKMGKAVADLARAEFKAAVEKVRKDKGASD